MLAHAFASRVLCSHDNTHCKLLSRAFRNAVHTLLQVPHINTLSHTHSNAYTQYKFSRDIGVLQRRLHYSLREVIIGGG